MKINKLSIDGAFESIPQTHVDSRGYFRETFNVQEINKYIPFSFLPIQQNTSVSKKSVIRGIHFSNSLAGQTKYVTCTFGKVLDVIVDLRVGSPTFLNVEYIELNPSVGNSIFVPTGVGHGFVAIEDESTVSYLLSTAYDPTTEQTIYPFDDQLGIDWKTENPILSSRDRNAGNLQDALRLKLLSNF